MLDLLRTWAYAAALPVVGGWMMRRGVAALSEEMRRTPANTREFAALEPGPVGQRAVELWERVLSQLTEQRLIEHVLGVWARTRDPRLGRIIAARGWVSRRNARTWLLCLLQSDSRTELAACPAAEVGLLVGCAAKERSRLRSRARRALRELTEPAARNELARIALEEGAPEAVAACRDADVRPEDTTERALLFLALGRWDDYDALDFDRRLLGSGYRVAPRRLRRRLLATMRTAGRLDLVRGLSGTGRDEVLAPSHAEAVSLVEALVEREDWDALWEQAQRLPAPVAVRILRSLDERGWRPPQGPTRDAFERSVALATDGWWDDDEAARLDVLDAAAHHTLELSDGEARGLVFHPTEPWLAVAGADGTLCVWDCEQEDELLSFGPYPSGADRVVYAGDGTLVFQDVGPVGGRAVLRSLDRALIDVFATPDGRAVSLQSAGESTVLSVSIRGAVQTWNVHDGALLGERDVPGRGPVTACISPNGTRAALIRGGRVELCAVPGLGRIATTPRPVEGAGARCCFSPGGGEVIVGTQDGGLVVLVPRSEELVVDGERLALGSGAVEGLHPLPSCSALLTWDATHLTFTGWIDRRVLARVPHGRKTLSAVAVSADEAWLAIVDDGWSVTLHDLRLLGALALVGCQVHLAPGHVPALGLVPSGGDGGVVVDLVREILHHRFATAVDVEDVVVEGVGAERVGGREPEYSPGRRDIAIE